MKQFYPIIAAALCLLFAGSNTSSWEIGADIPIPVRGGNAAAYSSGSDNWLIIVSGRDKDGAIIKDVQRYNVNTNKWDKLADHPTGLLGGAVTTLGNEIYVIGGVINPPGYGESTVYKYNINSNSWSLAADFPSKVVDAKAAGYQDSLIYVAGGISDLYEGGGIYLYNSNTNSWRKATPFPSASTRSFGGFAITGNTIVYMCGTDGFGSSNYFDSVYVGVIDRQDRSVIKWKRGANFPGKTRTFFDAHQWKDGIIITGGSTDNTFNTSSNECYVFKPADDKWIRMADKQTPWLTGQSGTVQTADGVWKLICASGYDKEYLPGVEMLSK